MAELASFFREDLLEAGCDEAGRGCYAGPVCAAAVILPRGFNHPLLNDSKKMKAADRNILREIIEKEAVSFAVAMVSNEEIDQINILKASFLAMHRAIDKLNTSPELLLIDGNRFTPYPGIPHVCHIKGDGRFTSIAAASVLAKTYRDEWMDQLHLEYPDYGWSQNKGYGTLVHRTALEKIGISPYHRKSFRLFPEAGTLFEKM